MVPVRFGTVSQLRHWRRVRASAAKVEVAVTAAGPVATVIRPARIILAVAIPAKTMVQIRATAIRTVVLPAARKARLSPGRATTRVQIPVLVRQDPAYI